MINNYLFTFNDEDRSMQYAFKIDDDAGHCEVVTQFLQFLSGVYGYDLTEKYLDDSSSNS